MSILQDCRRMVGLADPDDTFFDDQLILYINSVFSELYQIGIGPDNPFIITNGDENWEDFATDTRLNCVKPYVGNKVRLMFDPPASSTVVEALKTSTDRLEFMLRVATREIKKEELDARSGT